MIKYLIIILSLTILCGCATNDPKRLERAEKYQEQSEIANNRASRIGSREGTPDNIESMERAYEDSAHYRKKAHDEKYKDTFGSIVVGLIIGIITIAFK